jgi:phosphohistidine swiveling domain-containing protein
LAKRYIYSLSTKWLPSNVGSKAANLNFLLHHHVQVPDSWVIIWTACHDNLHDSLATKAAIRVELNTIIDPQKKYAVRSSASVEDSGDFSCAGLFTSYLQVQGIENIMDSIVKVWESLNSPEFETYWNNIMPAGATAHMAVIIQEMVQAKFSGVVFTKNPMTGLSETIIEAGPGTGESQNENHQDPERWISKWGLWSQKPTDNMLDEALARKIVVQATEISLRYLRPADLEWAWDGEKLYFLQIRPITHLDIPIYSNRIAREMLPGVIKPLVWSVNTRLINPTWVRILERLTGEHSWDPTSLTGHYYFRAYFNMGIFARVFERLGMPGEALELLLGLEQDGPEKPHLRPGFGILPRLPRLLAFGLSFIGINHRLNRLIKVKKASYETIVIGMNKDREPSEWLQMALQVFDETKEVAYYNIMIPMLAMMHHRMFSRLLKNNGHDARLIELRGAKQAAAIYNPQNTLQTLHNRYYGNLGQGQQADQLSPEIETQLQLDINCFLEEFGHFSDSGNDCSSIPWRETPDLIRRMIARPQQASKSELEVLHFEDLPLSWLKRIVMGFVFRGTSRFAVSREAISSLYTYGYGQFRNCFVRLGESLVRQGILDDREDIYYLYWQELEDIVEKRTTEPKQALVASRRQAILSYHDAVLPELILGSAQPPVMMAFEGSLKGIPTSLGMFSGPARVIQGINEFEKLNDGDVLIIPFSDVGWTPLFAKAGAVVAESGGMLSHSSIVAREYGIPAVVSVAGACRLADGTQISVNGYTGEIALL